MNDATSTRPPRLPERLLRWLLPSGIVGESIVGDMREEYQEYLETGSRIPPAMWYWGRVYLIARRYLWRKPAALPQGFREPRPSITERVRQSAGFIIQDLQYGLRMLCKRRLFTVIAVLTLGLGIGGTTAIFSIVDAVLIRDLPYRDPERLVSVWKAWPNWRGVEGLDYVWDHIAFPWVDYQNVKTHATTLSDVAAFTSVDLMFTGQGEPERLSVGRASANLFDLLGVQPVLGRTFMPEEVPPIAEQEGSPVVLLSYEMWSRRFGRDPHVLGETLLLGGIPYDVVGVLPADLRISSDLIRTHQKGGEVDAGLRGVWLPLRQDSHNSNDYELLARLAPGISVDQARTQIQGLLTRGPENQLARVESRKDFVTKGFTTPLLLLLGAAGILLIIACVNIAGLLVGEATNRCHEVTVRYALGAGRGRVVRQLLTENVLLGLTGAALGLLLAWLVKEALLSVAPPLPRLEEVTLSVRVLLFTTAAGITTGLLFSLAPISALGGRSFGKALRLRGQSPGRGGRRIQNGVVSIQVALTFVLLLAGGLFARSMLELLTVDPGFSANRLASVEVLFPQESAPRPDDTESVSRWTERMFGEVMTAAESVDGVQAVTSADYVPFGGGTWTSTIRLDIGGQTVGATHYIRHVLPTYHEVMEIPLKSGRLFTASDGPGSPRVMLISEGLAELYWHGESPLGATATYWNAQGEPVTIVGVVGDVRKQALGSEAEPTFYFPATQYPREPDQKLTLVVQTVGEPATVLRSLREAIRQVDPTIWIGNPTTLPALVRDSESDDRFRTVLMLTFAALATLLSAVGIFGITVRSVAARTKEMGIRMALGAGARGLIRLVLSDSMLSAAIGAAVGLAVASWATKLIKHFLFGVEISDPTIYLGVLGLLMLVCLGAAYVPAKRVMKISPIEVMTEE